MHYDACHAGRPLRTALRTRAPRLGAHLHRPDRLDTLDYVRVAIIEATGSGEWTNQSEMLEAIRRKAGELGGNGVILPRVDEPSAGAKVAAAFLGTGTQRKGNAVAVRVIGPKRRTTPPESSIMQRLRDALTGSG